MASEPESILDKLDAIAPIQRFDAFPKVQSTFRSRTTGGGFLTILVLLLSTLLVLNDFAEFMWGWPDSEFSVDDKIAQTMTLNADLVVNMPCHYLTVDLRDAVGERLHLSNGFRRDGTIFDPNQAQLLRTYQTRATWAARDIVALSRKNRGFFAWLWNTNRKQEFAPTYNYRPDGSACRIYGSVEVKKVTANLHITTLGHGYGSREHTDHSMMNLSHIITEFSFGPYIPDIVQPLDYSYEKTSEPFTVFQYFLNVVPTTYHATPSRSVTTNQYSVTHYVKYIKHGEVHQRTTTFIQFLVRVVGVIGGVWVCAGWAFKIGGKAAEVVVGSSDEDTLAEATSSSRKSRWAGGVLINERLLLDGTRVVPPGGVGQPPRTTHMARLPPAPCLVRRSARTPPLHSLAHPFSGGIPASPYPAHGPTPSGQWPASLQAPPSLPHTPPMGSGFPSSPLPPPPSAPSPYLTPGFQRSVSGGAAVPSSPYSGIPTRPPSSLGPNTNRASSYGSPTTAEKER
ncbi:hypothetical protein BS47DRAFT_1396547 [Hydnum rufescens UP504]|uniref:DUF1692-domain-containing protein n=1 Tax=Hydnum rufescens UP504 TaxID=1448309 RepID=A0A9P6DSR7_9AGAM|nr:hypothetical protein BS47DRAFT_1396547 [Hydnum rufescens UP504]